jgi:DNA-binding NtrC family response regulator
MVSPKKMKLFLVDDDEFSLNMYHQHLLNLGYTDITLFSNGSSCLNNLSHQPGIIILDQEMDDLSGISVLKKVKGFNPDIYVILLSGTDDHELLIRSIKYGAFDFITKDTGQLEKMTSVLAQIQEAKELLTYHSRTVQKK